MAGVKQQVEVEGRSLSLSNLDKALYPGNGFTKAQVIDYYIRIAPWMLAHYAKRPVTMKRFPDGVRGKAFYEKDAPKHTPDWVHTTDVPPGDRHLAVCHRISPKTDHCSSLITARTRHQFPA
jgi:DNA primase